MAKRQQKSRNARTRSRDESGSATRLQKFLASAGLGSRRQCEELIAEGRVAVNGTVVTEPGTRVDSGKDKVEVDGSRVRSVRHQYFMVNKPPGVVSTSADPAGRMRVIDLINTDQRVYNVGRLDKSSEGLILVTNDGELANRLTHPRYGVQKTYLVTVNGNPRWEDLQLLKKGVRLAEGVARVTEVRIKKRRRKNCELQIVLDEGRNREIRRLLARIGHKVTRLKRVAIGPLQLDTLPAGSWRRLEAGEIEALKRASAGSGKPRKAVGKPLERDTLERKRRKESRGSAKSARRKPVAKPAAKKKRPASRKSAAGKQTTGGRTRSAVKTTSRHAGPGKRATAGQRRKTAKKQTTARTRKITRRSRD